MTNKTIDEILELDSEIVVENPVEVKTNTSMELVVYDNTNKVSVVSENQENEDEDSEFVRKNLKELLKVGTNSLKRLSTFAESGESARSYEVVATMIKTLSDTSLQLMQVHKSKAETKRLKTGKSADPDKDKPTNTTTTNLQQNINVDQAVFVGSSADLLKQIKDKKINPTALLTEDKK